MTIRSCTIIARNYLASARVLFSSFIANNPGATLSVLVIDDRLKTLSNGTEPFEILHIDEIGIDQSEIFKMAAIYNVTEFATAVKPWLIHTLIERWNEPVMYLDPDIMVFQSLEKIVELAREHDIVITPHVSQPIPRDNLRVSESEILAAGIYNLGFIGVGVNGIQFLEFWKDRLKRECISDPPNMRFVDQRWVDFAPAIFDAFILKDPTYNVAYWNLHNRIVGIDRETGHFLIDGQPIHFFHFSGYNPKVPELLSKYQGGKARILFSREPILKQLCDLYGQQLFEHGHVEISSYEYGFSVLDNGLTYDGYMRSAYREALIRAEANDSLIPPNPFELADLFLLWLNTSAENDRTSRYLKRVYESRIDLQQQYASANAAGVSALLAWCRVEASKGNFDRRLIPFVVGQSYLRMKRKNKDVLQKRSSGGIQIAGYFKAEMGVGELGRNLVKAVNASGIPFSTFTDIEVVYRQNTEFEELKGDNHDVNIICMNADSMAHFAHRMGAEYYRNRYTIGVWSWELEEFPEEFDASFEYVDEIWASSEFTRKAIAERGLKPVYAFPVAVDKMPEREGFDLSILGIPNGYVFLFCFDLLSIFERKNPLALIEAFTTAFQNNEGPVLVIKALNGDKRLADLEKIRIRSRDRSDIVILDKYLDRDDNLGLFGASNCYVSLHRSEGLGLTIAEAMALGKPVIATAYSGNMDFMDQENSFLIPFTYGEVPDGCEPYRTGARWAEPDIAEAVRVMRYVYENQGAASLVGERARQHMSEMHSLKIAADFITVRYEHALNSLHQRDHRKIQDRA